MYYLRDIVMIKAEEGLCHIGQITRIHIQQSDDNGWVRVRMFGRINKLGLRPSEELKDEVRVHSPLLLENAMSTCERLVPELKEWLENVALSLLRLATPSRASLILEKQKPLRALDPFAGAGAFGMGLEEYGCIEVTHAVEIFSERRKDLEIIYQSRGYAIGENRSRISQRTPTSPAPPKPEDINCIIAGFPCQPHSRLNMFVKANDRKSNLILNVLSVKGGTPMGGLKFLIRAMTDMNYQVCYGILQAGHYGTPQTRVRFFMIAA
ncbi:S-adenosyl-L-methionine-dependent methyltransferase, partial [Suillus subalutaceus]|uniref:S-adenosyl-L-methionine-dependent methyltransferase n=1 Tax=Suillus subalutaceus TaxID=48586 RepID=UPI001B85B9C5